MTRAPKDPWAESSWSQPATGGMPDMSRPAGAFAPLWTDEVAPGGTALYDRSLDVYLVAYVSRGSIHVRASRDLIHWTGTIGVIPFPTAPAAGYFYPNLLGETGDPTVGGGLPRLYFSAFPANAFPDYKQSTFEYVELTLCPDQCIKSRIVPEQSDRRSRSHPVRGAGKEHRASGSALCAQSCARRP